MDFISINGIRLKNTIDTKAKETKFKEKYLKKSSLDDT